MVTEAEESRNSSNSRLRGSTFEFKVLFKILRPVAKLLLRREMTATEAIRCLKLAFVEAAENDFTLQKKKMTNARIAVLTGLDRNEVSRIRKQVNRDGSPLQESVENLDNLNRAARVATNWPEQADGKPAILAYEKDTATDDEATRHNISFTELVHAYSGGIPPKAVLDELLRVGMVEQNKDSSVVLRQSSFVPEGKDDKLDIAGMHIARFIRTIDDNLIAATRDEESLQLELSFDNLEDNFVEAFRQLSKQEGRAMLEKWNRDLIRIIREGKTLSNNVQSNIEGTTSKTHTRKTGVGLYFYDEDDE